MLRTMSIILTASLLLPIWAAQASAQELPESEVEAWRGPMNEFSAYDIDLSGGLSREEFTRAADPRLDDRSFDEFDLDLDEEVEPEELEEMLVEDN
ncbi:hypothetical protein [Desulfocurvibacter africanus]|uniref:hypothetical protein n=1 Tax=Desulfocurvibacter africanus TaxID=873 RepID=UPI000414F7AC|nr:hypothetical protein [Desulfocurvibacter africanus]